MSSTKNYYFDDCCFLAFVCNCFADYRTNGALKEENFTFYKWFKAAENSTLSGVKIIYTCQATLTTCHSLPCLPSSKGFCPLLTLREALIRPILLLSHHLSSFRHETHKAFTVSLQRKRYCDKFFLCLPPPDYLDLSRQLSIPLW